MFSGIVEEVGRVKSYDGATMVVSASAVLSDLKVSESINVSGACLTVVRRDASTFTVETVPETVRRTFFGSLRQGSAVNLERSLALGARIGGHMVQGHVDGTGTVSHVQADGNELRLGFTAPANIIKYVVEKGFIAVDGVSLTVTDRTPTSFSVALVPYTVAHTTFSEKRAGDPVNLEADITLKYLEQMIGPYLHERR